MRRPWIMAQSWRELLFAHWRVPPAALAPLIPAPLRLDTRNGDAWLAVTPFVVHGARPRLLPPLPAFPEINVRTYVTADGVPGIWFLSLDAANRLAVATARRVYRLPYFRARMAAQREGDRVRYRHERLPDPPAPPARFQASYEPCGPGFRARPGTLEHWLVERYRLFVVDGARRVLRGEIRHEPWSLQPARAEIAENTMAAQAGLELRGAPLLHYAARQDVIFWALRPSAVPSHGRSHCGRRPAGIRGA